MSRNALDRLRHEGRLAASGALALYCSLALALAACENGVPTFPDLHDAGIECSDERACEYEGDVCLEGRCYRPCTSTCGPQEVCSGGVCMRGTPGDAGPRDAGAPDAPDLCEGVMCVGGCRAGVCVECFDASDCGGGTPICDVGRGRCVGYAPAICAPCNTNLDCGEGSECVTREGVGGEPMERICLPTCSDDSTCDANFRCDGSHCVPRSGFSCMTYRAVVGGQACTVDAECSPIVRSPESTGGACDGASCRLPCASEADCPPFLAICDGSYCG